MELFRISKRIERRHTRVDTTSNIEAFLRSAELFLYTPRKNENIAYEAEAIVKMKQRAERIARGAIYIR